jgi:hypothetical protein
MIAGVHGLLVVVDEGLFGGRSRWDVNVEGSMAERRFWRAGGWPARIFGGRRCFDVDICKDT